MDKLLKDDYHVIGVMSGTSLDGVDLAQCRFYREVGGGWAFTIGSRETLPYPAGWRAKLETAMSLPPDKLRSLNRDYSSYLADCVGDFIERHALKDLDAVCSHGHTVHHRPEQGFTLQIGNLPELATGLPCPVVCDFRVQDVELGGQGAPLVPIGDATLFSKYDYCLNLGGFANCSTQDQGNRIAYDICPVNVVLNRLAQLLGEPFDRDGRLAAAGVVDKKLLTALDQLPYYNQPPPKSLGMEWVNAVFLPVLDNLQRSTTDLLATATAHMTNQLAGHFGKGKTVLVSGGGAYNDLLMAQLKEKSPARFVIPEASLVEFKEALIFGWLGVLRLRREHNCLASVTGAQRDHCSGVVYGGDRALHFVKGSKPY